MKNLFLTKTRWLVTIILLTALGSGNVWGADVTFTFSSYGWSNGTAHTSVTSSPIKITANGGGNNGKYYTSDKSWRMYSGGSLTITAETGYQVTAVSSKPTQTFTVSNGSASISFTGTVKFTSITVTYTDGGGGGDCSECTYYVYNGSTWESIGTTGFEDVVLAPPTLPSNAHGAGNGCWVTDKNIYDGGNCVKYASGDKYRYVPRPGGAEPDAENKPGSGTCELYAVYAEANGCLSTTVTAVQCARIWEEPEPNTPSVSGSDVTLSWSSVKGASGYHLYVTDYDSYELDENVDGTSKTITGLAGGTYSWTVAANSPKDDACDSKASDGEDFEIVDCTDISSSTVSSANISITPAKTTATISWSAVANASSYEVKVYAGATASGVAVWTASPDPTSTSCTATGLTANTQYTVAIKAKNACSTSSTAGTKTFMTQNLTLYHIDFVNQNNTSSHPAQLEQTSEGQNLDIPANSGGNVTAPSAACSSADWTFAGWKVGSAQEETTSAPSLVAAGTTGYAMDGNKTFYAVFTKTEGGGGGGKTTLLTSDFETDNEKDKWTHNTTYRETFDGSNTIRMGSGNYAGSITSTSLSAPVGTTITVACDLAVYSSDGTTVTIAVSDAGSASVDVSSYSTLTAVSKTFVTTTATFTVTISTPAKKKRSYVDNIEIYYGGGGGGTTYWNSNPSCSNEATVTYHNDGAKSGAAPTDANSPYTIGDNVTVLGTGTMVAPDGKEFKCWNTAPDGTGTDYNIDAKFEIAGNMDFYPKWVNAPYTVRFDAEGGTCGTTSLTEASGGAGVTLPAATATCAPAGWSFYGWATSTCGSTTSAPSIVGATGETYYPESDITLHAVYVNSGTYNSNPVCHEVTIGSHTNGTINVNSSTTSPQTVTQGATVNIAATPESGYRFTGWTIKKTTGGNDVTSTLLGANATTASTSFTMPDYDVTVSATFTAKVMRNIIWKNNGVELTDAERGSANTSMEVGEKLTAIPTLASGAVGKSCDTEGHPTFVGWTATPWNGEEPTAAGLFTADNLPTMPAGEGPITYHAVWADGSGVFELVTSAPSNWSGTYLIVSGTQAMSSDFHSGTSGEFKASEVTISNNKIECTDDKLIWIVAKNGDNAQYSFKNKSTGTYAKITGTSSTNAALDANAVWFTIENASGNVYDIVSVSKSARCFAYYPTNTSFRTYAKNSSNTGSLYKASEATSYITSCSCPAYSFHFGTRSQSDWSDKVSYCFQESGDADGNSGVYWYLEDFVLPDKPHYYVGWQGSWNTTEAKSADADFSGLCFGLLRENSCGTNTLGTYSSGNNQGAVGTLRVRSSYADNNKYIDFIPGGYVLRLSDDNGSSYTSTEFVAASANLTETVWMTDLTTISAALASSGKYFVDLKTSSDHVWAPNISQVIATSNMGYKKVDGSWGTGLSSGMRGKFRIWADNCSKNWNCHFVPYYHLSYDGNGAGATNLPEASDDKSCEGDVAARTVVVSSTVPTRDGYTFVGWNTAADGSGTAKAAGDNVVLTSDVVLYAQWRQNFTVTYDLNSGAADPICSGGTYYVGQSVTVCSTTPTKTSSSFLGWLVYKTGDKNTTVTVTAGQFTMPAYNVTIEAQWETVYYHIYYKEEDGTAIATDDVPQTAETTLRNQTPCVGYTFFGWSTSKITSETTTKPSIIGKGGASYTPDADITVYPVYARSEGATTVKDTLTVANTGVTTSYTPVEGINKDKTPKTIHSNAVYAIGAYNSSGMQFTDGTSNEDQKKSSLITTTSGGSLQAIQARIPYAASTTRYLYTKGNTSDYTMQNRSSQGGTLAWTITHSKKADTWYIHDFSEDGYSSFFMYCGGGATKVDSIIVTWGTGTYYYATHCETKENVTVTYNGNGGTTTCGDGEHKVTWAYKNGGADAPELENPQTICSAATRDGGYILRDWTTGADGTGTHYTPGASITSLANDITLYAQWDRVYTVTFNDQGAITSRTQASGGASVAVPSATSPCIKDGVTWTFAGWGTVSPLSQSLAGHIIIPSGTSTYIPTEDVTLYAVYRKELDTSDAFAVGTSGAYKISAKYSSGTKTCYASTKGNGLYNCSVNAGDASTFYLNYVKSGTYAGKYTLQNSAGEYIGWSSSTTLSFSEETPAYYTVTQSGDGWLLRMDGVTGSARYFTHESSTIAYNFKAYTEANPVYFTPAAAAYYYTTMSCDDDFSITFHANGGTITWNMPLHGEGTYQHLADGTEIDVFPTASFDGWTFLGWRAADYDESTTAPEPSTIYGGSDGESGYHFTIHSNTDMYPIFTRFEDNEPFDQINGGDYYIYFLDENQIDEYGAYKRVYAASYSDNKRYNSTAVCDNATTFTFTKLGNGNWTIYDNTTKKYLYGVANDALKQQASATGAEWTLTLNGNQFDAFHVGTTYGQITASGNGTSATFMNYSRDNLKSNPGLYHRVYLGSCTNRTFTTNPSTTPNIEIHGQVKVTSTAGKSIKSTSVLTVSASNIATANLTVTSDNSAFKFSLTSNGTYSASVNIPVVSNKVGVTPIYVEYTPSATEDGIEEATITVSDGASPTPTEVSTESGDVQGRHVPANFVIAAKWGNKWYALPANCTESTSSTTGVLIEVDNALDPTRATAAPSYTKWGLQTVRPSRKAEYGTRLVFTEQLTTATADDQKTLYNGSTTSIQANAMYQYYLGDATVKYEWIPTTTDLKDYVLTSATTLSGDASARTVSLSNKGVFGTLLINKSNDGKVRILPADFYEPVEMQVIEWKANSLVVMYGGAGIKATTQVGNNDPSSLQTLASAKVDHGVYELTTSQALTSSTNMPLTIAVKNGSDVTTGTCALIVPAIVTGAQDAPLGLTADEATLTDVVVTDGATLSAVATKYTFKNITVYPGGKLVIGSGKQLGMASLTLRGGSSWGAATYEHKYPQFVVNNTTSGAYSNTSGVINYDYVTTKDQYYSFVLPYASNTKNIKYPLDIYGSNVSASNTGSFEFQYYDGAARAAEGTGWKVLEEDPSTGADLVVGKGYTFLGMPKKIYAYDGTETRTNVRQRYGIHRIPMNVAAATVQAGETNSDPGKATPISVTLASKNNNSGWALVGNPYLSNVSGLNNQDIQVGKLVHTDTNPWDGKWQWDDTNPATGVRYIVTTDDGQTFESQQARTATLKAFKNFFVQIQNGEATSLVIPANTRTDKDLAPARYMADVEQDIQLAVDLVSETRSDKVDLLINDVYTAEFDQDGDFTKMMNTTKFNLYGVYPGDNLSFIAVDKTTAAGSIAIGYQVPAAGEYTLQLSDRAYVMTDALEALYVTDHEVSPEVTTDLLENPYSFTVTKAETNDARFTVSIKLKENQDTPTDIDIINGGGDLDGEKPIKFIYHDKMYILRNGVLYDATGKKVREIK